MRCKSLGVLVLSVCASLGLVACTSTAGTDAAPQQMSGVGGDVRVDAQLPARSRAGEPIRIEYVVTNERAAPITIVDVPAQSTFDEATHTATVKIGAATPGSAKLIRLAPGEKRSFSSVTRLQTAIANLSGEPDAANRTLLRLQVNFLDDGRPESVYTNAIPAYR